MQPPQQHSRINLAELKAQLVKVLGPEGSKQYFSYLHRFLSLKLSKVEFNKLCLRILGRENITLHNHLIHSILKNSSTAKSPPPIIHKDDASKHGMKVGGKDVAADINHNKGSHNNTTHPSFSAGLSNGGDVLPISPRQARSGGKANFAHQLTANKSSGSNVVLENGNIEPPDIERLAQHHQEIARPIHKNNELAVSRLPDGSAPVHIKGQTELTVRNDSKQDSAKAPIGDPLGSSQVSVGRVSRSLSQANSSSRVDVFSHGALLDSVTLRERMEHIALTHGLEGVSLDCANLLNHGLDSYLKGLIGSSIKLSGSRSGHKLTENDADAKLINSHRPGYQLQTQSSGNHLVPISFQDFRVAMELNPRKLGRDWPLLLEKVSTRAFEE